MGGLRSLKAYQVSERLTLDCISEYMKCCSTLAGYLIGVVLQRQDRAAAARGVGEALATHHCRGDLAVLFLHATYAWGNQAKHPDKSRLYLGSHSSSSFT